MKYRFMEVTSLYSEYVNRVENEVSGTYKELCDAIINDRYCESRPLHKELNLMGVESCIVFYNYDKAQKVWDDDPIKDRLSIFIRQLKEFQPDVLMVSDVSMFSKDNINTFREVLGRTAKIICFHFSTFTKDIIEALGAYDLCLTGSEKYVNDLIEYNANTKLLRHAFDTSVLANCSKEKINKVAFVGSVYLGKDMHSNRVEMLKALLKAGIPFDFYGKILVRSMGWRGLLEWFMEGPKKFVGDIITLLKIKNKSKKSTYGIDYYKTISRYMINLNCHAPINGAGAGNMRMYEVTGVGSCLVTDSRKENTDIFKPDEEIVVYEDICDLVNKVKYLMDNPEVCKKISENGQKRTLNEYSYARKAEILDGYIEKLLQ